MVPSHKSSEVASTGVRLRILVDCAPLSGGGGSQVASAFLENLAQTGDVDWRAVVTTATVKLLSPELQTDVRLLCVEKRNWLDIFRIGRRLAREEKAFVPDVVFSVFGPTYFQPRARHLVGFALPLMIYDLEPPLKEPRFVERLKTWLGKRAFKKVDHIVVETETVKARLSARLGIDEAKISVIGNSVNPLFSAALSKAHASSEPVFRMLVPSAYYPHKNLEIIPYVASELRKLAPNFAFEFNLTLDPDHPGWLAIAKAANQLNVAKHIHTLGTQNLSDLARHYHRASAVFLPTIREASTAVYPESFFSKRPLVTSDIDFARELCGDAALYVPPTDPVAIAAQLWHLSRDANLRARLVEMGEVQLQRCYPPADLKFSHQMDLIKSMTNLQNQIKQQSKTSAVSWHDENADDFNSAYDRSPAFTERYSVWKSLIETTVKPSDRVIDIGCGSGTFSFVAAKQAANVCAIDGSPNMIKIANIEKSKRQVDNVNFSVDLLENLPVYEREGYDIAIISSVLEYVPTYLETIRNVFDVMKPGGSLIMSMPNKSSIYRLFERISYKILKIPSYYSTVHNIVYENDLCRELTKAGFVVEEATYYADPPIFGNVMNVVFGKKRAKSLFVVVAVKP